MTRPQILGLVALVALALGALTLGSTPKPGSLDLALDYLAARGRDVRTLDLPVDAQTDGTLLVALTGPQSWEADEALGLLAWVQRGGHVVLLPSLDAPLPERLGDAFGLVSYGVERPAPGTYDAWSARQAAATTLTGALGVVRVREGAWRVPCVGGQTDMQDRLGEARACTIGIGKGEVKLVADTSVFGGDLLALADNLTLLEALFPEGAPVLLDYHITGQVRGEPLAGAGVIGGLLAQGALLYLLALWQRARPLGPTRIGLPDREPGMVRELRTLGSLHAAAGHGLPAARRMLEMARSRLVGDDRLLALPKDVHTLPEAIAAGAQLASFERRSG